MIQIRRLIENLRGRADLSVQDLDQAWLIRIPKGENHVCEVTIPHSAFEWFACVKRLEDNMEVWSDWLDHYDSTDDKLDTEMAESISAFIERVTASELQLPLQIGSSG